MTDLELKALLLLHNIKTRLESDTMQWLPTDLDAKNRLFFVNKIDETLSEVRDKNEDISNGSRSS